MRYPEPRAPHVSCIDSIVFLRILLGRNWAKSAHEIIYSILHYCHFRIGIYFHCQVVVNFEALIHPLVVLASFYFLDILYTNITT